jgi:hypothetical protein
MHACNAAAANTAHVLGKQHSGTFNSPMPLHQTAYITKTEETEQSNDVAPGERPAPTQA